MPCQLSTLFLFRLRYFDLNTYDKRDMRIMRTTKYLNSCILCIHGTVSMSIQRIYIAFYLWGFWFFTWLISKNNLLTSLCIVHFFRVHVLYIRCKCDAQILLNCVANSIFLLSADLTQTIILVCNLKKKCRSI